MVWPHFPEPQSSLVVDSVESLEQLLSSPKLRQTIDNHPSNQVIQLVVPRIRSRGRQPSSSGFNNDIRTVAPAVASLVVDEDEGPDLVQEEAFGGYFLVNRVPLHLFLHKLLIDNYVKKGSFLAFSANARVECDNCLDLSPNGLLRLSVDEKTYHRLGLEGKRSQLFRKKNVYEKYIIEIDLKSSLCEKVDGKYYQRTFGAMRRSGLTFDVLIKWEPDYGLTPIDVSPLSVKKFFEWIKCNPGVGGGFMSANDADQMKVWRCAPRVRRYENKNTFVPKLWFEPNGEDDERRADKLPPNNVTALIEWVGAQLCSVSCDQADYEADVSSFGFDAEVGLSLSSVSCCEASGFFTPREVMTLVSQMESLTNCQSMAGSVPFVALVVNGFEDCVTSWTGKNNEHGKRTSGENLYGVLISNKRYAKATGMGVDEGCLFWRIADGFDFSIEKL